MTREMSINCTYPRFLGMNADNQQKWRDGTLTIGELLLTQPSVILQNDS